MKSPEKLRAEILPLSSSQMWLEACLEWSLIDIHINEDTETCLCGHNPIVEICIIKNRVTKNIARVGNHCVHNFMGLASRGLFGSIRRIMDDSCASLSEDVIHELSSWKTITSWERDFYLDILRKRKLSERQREIKTQINEKVLAHVLRRHYGSVYA